MYEKAIGYTLFEGDFWRPVKSYKVGQLPASLIFSNGQVMDFEFNQMRGYSGKHFESIKRHLERERNVQSN